MIQVSFLQNNIVWSLVTCSLFMAHFLFLLYFMTFICRFRWPTRLWILCIPCSLAIHRHCIHYHEARGLTDGVVWSGRSTSSRERRSRSPRERDTLERSSRSRQQRSRSREHEYHDRGDRHVEYTRERSHERELPIVQERSRERSRERDPYDRSSREISERGRVSSDSRRYETERHRGSEREYSSSRSSRH